MCDRDKADPALPPLPHPPHRGYFAYFFRMLLHFGDSMNDLRPYSPKREIISIILLLLHSMMMELTPTVLLRTIIANDRAYTIWTICVVFINEWPFICIYLIYIWLFSHASHRHRVDEWQWLWSLGTLPRMRCDRKNRLPYYVEARCAHSHS